MTPVHRKIMAILADGQPHRDAELRACLSDELGDVDNIEPHISMLRRALHPIGQDLVLEKGPLYGRYYRWVRVLASSYDGRK